MKTFCWIIAIATLAVAPVPAQKETAQETFVRLKCNQCHAIETLGVERTSTSDKMKGKDLSDVGSTREASWIIQYVKKELEEEGKLHKRSFKGTDEEMVAIAAWLETLKATQPDG